MASGLPSEDARLREWLHSSVSLIPRICFGLGSLNLAMSRRASKGSRLIRLSFGDFAARLRVVERFFLLLLTTALE